MCRRPFLVFLILLIGNDGNRRRRHVVKAFSPPILVAPPVLGIGALLFKPSVKLIKSSEMEDDDALAQAGRFFVDAFWYVIVSSSVWDGVFLSHLCLPSRDGDLLSYHCVLTKTTIHYKTGLVKLEERPPSPALRRRRSNGSRLWNSKSDINGPCLQLAFVSLETMRDGRPIQGRSWCCASIAEKIKLLALPA